MHEGGSVIPPGSVPARHTDPRARRDPAMLPEMVTLAEVERRIMRCDDEIARLVEDHFTAAEDAASAEADWKQHRDRCLVRIADRGDKEAADIREARAKVAFVDAGDPKSLRGEDLYRTYKLLEAREKSVDRALRAVQTRASGLMSVAKGIRHPSGL